MTFREKLVEEHPNWDEEKIGRSIRLCPYSYGYEDEKDSPCKPLEPSIIKCRECWDREIPGDRGSALPERVSKDEYYLDIARAVSRRSTCLKRQYGAVIVKNDEIISTGYNGSPRGEVNCCDTGICKRLDVPSNTGNYIECHSVHAEMNALLSARRSDMIGATLYLAGYDVCNGVAEVINEPCPCPICDRLIRNAGISAVVV